MTAIKKGTRRAIGVMKRVRRGLDSCDLDDSYARERRCGTCGWSWFREHTGCLLCLNLDSPRCYDSVSPDLSCRQFESESAE